MESNNNENFRLKFLEEAHDLIGNLENYLLQLDKTPSDKNIVESIFRAMHSLKGEGAMFGFGAISNLTHDLESIYDLIRSDKLAITPEILSLTLEVIDFIKEILTQPEQAVDAQKQQLLLNRIHQLDLQEYVSPLVGKTPTIEQEPHTYYVYFAPKPQALLDGSKPMFLLDEISSIGSSFIIAHSQHIPGVYDLREENSYFAWSIFIATDNIEQVKDIFLFIQNNCELTISEISSSNLVDNKSFREEIEELAQYSQPIASEKIKFAVAKAEVKPVEIKTARNTSSDYSSNSLISSIRVASDKIDSLMNLVSEMVTTQVSLSSYAEKHKQGQLTLISENIETLTKRLRELSFNISLVPISTILTRYQRLVRDVSLELNKKVEFVTEGMDTELSKSIIQSINEPIMHLLRNCLDHGICSKSERIESGKPAVGKICMRAYYSGANVHIEISDDGKGIDLDFVRNKAIEKGLIDKNTQLSEKEIYDLLFIPGFTTTHLVSEISGRGVGMDVVKRNIQEIRGEVDVSSQQGKGTIFTLKIPLTLSIIDGLLTQVGNTSFIIPLNYVDKIYAVPQETVQQSFQNIAVLEGKRYPFYILRDEFKINSKPLETEQLILIKYRGQKIGFIVDQIMGEYQAVLKSMGRHYKKHESFSGATILGNGRIALVIDPNKLIKKFSFASDKFDL